MSYPSLDHKTGGCGITTIRAIGVIVVLCLTPALVFFESAHDVCGLTNRLYPCRSWIVGISSNTSQMDL